MFKKVLEDITIYSVVILGCTVIVCGLVTAFAAIFIR